MTAEAVRLEVFERRLWRLLGDIESAGESSDMLKSLVRTAWIESKLLLKQARA